jgi:hypothetical protein
MDKQQFRPSLAAEFAEINPTTFRGWCASGGFKPESEHIREVNEYLKHIHEDRRKPLRHHHWGAYSIDDLVRLKAISRLREMGWNLDAALAAVGQHVLSLDGSPVEALVITRAEKAEGGYALSRFQKESEAARFAAQQCQSGVLTIISVTAIRKQVEQRLSEMETGDDKATEKGKGSAARNHGHGSARGDARQVGRSRGIRVNRTAGRKAKA